MSKPVKDRSLESLVAEAWIGKRRCDMDHLEDTIAERLLESGHMRIRRGIMIVNHRDSREEVNRQAFVCTGCGGVYSDAPVTACDCRREPQEFIEGTIRYFIQP